MQSLGVIAELSINCLLTTQSGHSTSRWTELMVTDGSRQGLVPDLPPLRALAAVVRQDLATE